LGKIGDDLSRAGTGTRDGKESVGGNCEIDRIVPPREAGSGSDDAAVADVGLIQVDAQLDGLVERGKRRMVFGRRRHEMGRRRETLLR
jgi:hypothetical protein